MGGYYTCFVITRHAGIKEAFAFDQHFNTILLCTSGPVAVLLLILSSGAALAHFCLGIQLTGKFRDVLTGVVLVGLMLFVRFYLLPEDHVKVLAIPQAEKALGRTVQIGGIDADLFSGITVKDFTAWKRSRSVSAER